MKINIAEQLLPEVYNRHGKDCYLDPIRQKLIYITPEETVRQRMISYLAHQQVFDYCNLINADYAIVCNGSILYCYKYIEDTDSYEELNSVPDYAEMLEGKYDVITKESIPERMPYERMESYLKEVFAEYPDDYYGETISKSTPFNIAKAAFNFEEALFDIRHKLPKKDFGIFELIEDYGIRILSYGNAGGGYFGGPYRSFLIEYKGNIEFISFAFSTYARTEKTGIVKTCLNIAHDDEKETHHALQLSFDDNIQVIGDKVTIYHSGRIAIGNKGSGKIDELRQFVAERYPKIIDGKRFNLGSLKNDYQWNIDQPDVTEVIVNLISYALIRDEYRDYIKQQ